MKTQLKYYLLAQPGLAIIYYSSMWLTPFHPTTLPFTVFDNFIPYSDWFAAVYISFFVLLFLNRLFRSCTGILCLCHWGHFNGYCSRNSIHLFSYGIPERCQHEGTRLSFTDDQDS
jgi:hypothetical protein